MQKIWQLGSDWDQLLSDELKREVEEFRKATVVDFEIPRSLATLLFFTSL